MLQVSIAQCPGFAAFVSEDDVCVSRTNSRDVRTVSTDAFSSTSAFRPLEEVKEHRGGRWGLKNGGNLRERGILLDISRKDEAKEYSYDVLQHKNYGNLQENAIFEDISEGYEAKNYKCGVIEHGSYGNFLEQPNFWDTAEGYQNHGETTIFHGIAKKEMEEAYALHNNIRKKAVFFDCSEKMEPSTVKDRADPWTEKDDTELPIDSYGDMDFSTEKDVGITDFSIGKDGIELSREKYDTGIEFYMEKDTYNMELTMEKDEAESFTDRDGCDVGSCMDGNGDCLELSVGMSPNLGCALDIPLLDDAILGLQACKKQKDRSYAMHMYSCICGTGLETYLGNYIVPLYVECGNMALAQQVFNKLMNPNEYSWGALLSGFVQSSHLHEALHVYTLTKDKGVHLSSYVIVSLLQACSWLMDVRMGRELYTDILLKGYESDLPIYNSLIFMYSKCSLVTEAHSIFVRVPVQDVVSWTTLISGYVENGLYMIALKCFEEMKAGCVSPNRITFSCVLKACCSLGASEKGRDLHKELALRGLLNDSSIAINLISMYAKCGSLSEAQDVLSKLPVRDLASWTKLVQGYIECGASQEALKCFDQMQMECISLDAVAFACGLRACSALGSIEKGRDIHGCTLMKGLANALVVGNSLIGMYANCGSVLDAHLVFHKMPLQNSISWSALIVGYAEHGPGEEAIRLFDEMQLQGHFPNIVTFSSVLKACSTIKSLEKGREIHSCVSQCGLEVDPLVSNGLVHMYATCGELAEAQCVFDSIFAPDVVLWTELISGYADNGSGEKALHNFEQMQILGVVPDTATFTCSLKCCASIGAIGKGYEIHTLLVKKGCCKELSIGNSLIGMYAACGSLSEAQNVFDMLEVHDIMSWTSLIAGYAEHGSGQVALKCFKEMKDKGFFVDAITFASVLKACGNIGALQKGREIHAMVVEEEFDEDLSVSNSLITMYSRCGALEEAKDIFYSTTIHDSTAWGSMMKGYCMAHDGNAAIQCFEDMQKEGIKPDTVTFTCLLNACSHASLVSEGITYYKSMREQYKIVPTIEHHTCIIDLLGRSGKLYEAENLLSLYPSDEATWSALLTACRTYVEPELGLRCFQELIEINREDATWYALIADIFANAGCGHAATHIEQLRKHAGVKKNTAVAIIEVNNEVHEFSLGCIEQDEISRALKALNSFMLKQGHVPNLNRVLKPISDDEKEVVLCEHAEKVAIAFGLLNTPQGTTLRVTKNLRMCNDCHDVTKMISKIKNREIILRDTSCIHNFKDGMCSCGDLY